MHFVTGGAFNGKSKWVTEYYQLHDTPHLWISGYDEEAALDNPNEYKKGNIVIIEGVEVWLNDWIQQLTIDQARQKWQNLLQSWLDWEKQDQQYKIILIGTDITKGIVPMHAEERKWRDLTGWAYQDATKAANRVDLIWYGISQKLK